MNINPTPDQEARLLEIANHESASVEDLLPVQIERQFQNDALFLQAVEEGIAELDRGEFVEDEAVWASLESHLRS